MAGSLCRRSRGDRLPDLLLQSRRIRKQRARPDRLHQPGLGRSPQRGRTAQPLQRLRRAGRDPHRPRHRPRRRGGQRPGVRIRRQRRRLPRIADRRPQLQGDHRRPRRLGRIRQRLRPRLRLLPRRAPGRAAEKNPRAAAGTGQPDRRRTAGTAGRRSRPRRARGRARGAAGTDRLPDLEPGRFAADRRAGRPRPQRGGAEAQTRLRPRLHRRPVARRLRRLPARPLLRPLRLRPGRRPRPRPAAAGRDPAGPQRLAAGGFPQPPHGDRLRPRPDRQAGDQPQRRRRPHDPRHRPRIRLRQELRLLQRRPHPRHRGPPGDRGRRRPAPPHPARESSRPSSPPASATCWSATRTPTSNA